MSNLSQSNTKPITSKDEMISYIEIQFPQLDRSEQIFLVSAMHYTECDLNFIGNNATIDLEKMDDEVVTCLYYTIKLFIMRSAGRARASLK